MTNNVLLCLLGATQPINCYAGRLKNFRLNNRECMMNKKILFPFLLLVTFSLTGCWTTKSGQKSGVIVKVAKEGKYWGTYEGELIRGGLEDASGVTG